MKVIISAACAIVCAIFLVLCVERVSVGNVGVVYSAGGVEDEVLTQGWHLMNPLKSVKQFPVSQQQLVLSNNPGDYNTEEHQDWSIDAPADVINALGGRLGRIPGISVKSQMARLRREEA